MLKMSEKCLKLAKNAPQDKHTYITTIPAFLFLRRFLALERAVRTTRIHLGQSYLPSFFSFRYFIKQNR